jgi:Cu(I)/Ag(I) efflux system membrane fusion protein
MLAILASTAACSRSEEGRSEALVTEVGGLTLAVGLRPDPPSQKGNGLELRLTDARGNPVEGAQVSVEYVMPAMGAMAEMKGRAEVRERGEGRYRAAFDLPMGGSWTLSLEVQAAEAAASAEYRLTVGNPGLAPSGTMAVGRAATTAQLPRQELPAPVLASLQAALGVYEELRDELAADRMGAVPALAARLGDGLRNALDGRADLAGSVPQVIKEAVRAAESMAEAEELPTARAAFGEVSRALLLLAGCDPRLAQGWHIFACPMTSTFDKWIQPSPDLENPYMGLAMSTCGVSTDGSVLAMSSMEEARAHAEHAHGDEIAYYTCSMHPSVKKADEGTCPICSMNLVPVTRQEIETGVIFVDAQRRQTIGVRTASVERQRITVEIRAVGKVVYDETRLTDVTVKYRGWIGELHADSTGQRVKKGAPLFTLYSPELFAAQQEYLTVLESQRAARGTVAPDRADYLVDAARQRLRLWDIQDWQIEEVARRGQPLEYLPIVSPVSGYVIEKYVALGSTVDPGMKLYSIAALDRVWVEAEVYESELPLVAVGQEAEVSFPYLPGEVFRGKVLFIYPFLDPTTRTGRVRIELANPRLTLKPDMYADVQLEHDLGMRLAVPEEAVLYAGPRRFVFLDLGEGRLRPQQVQVGARAGTMVEVLGGLREGDVIVTSGNFLVAAESRLRVALEQWR